jgi:hypothetical protein
MTRKMHLLVTIMEGFLALDSTHFLLGTLSGTLVAVNISLAEDDVRVTATNTLDCGHSDWNLALSVNVGAHDTQNMLKLFGYDERHLVIF